MGCRPAAQKSHDALSIYGQRLLQNATRENVATGSQRKPRGAMIRVFRSAA
jgi:hypothetical protein